MISNSARIYKGGSWKDRGIWLNPSKRRWLDQKDKASDIGFDLTMKNRRKFIKQLIAVAARSTTV